MKNSKKVRTHTRCTHDTLLHTNMAFSHSHLRIQFYTISMYGIAVFWQKNERKKREEKAFTRQVSQLPLLLSHIIEKVCLFFLFQMVSMYAFNIQLLRFFLHSFLFAAVFCIIFEIWTDPFESCRNAEISKWIKIMNVK